VGASRHSPLKPFVHSFRRPFSGTPRVIATAAGQLGTNDTFAVTVRRSDNQSFAANIYRTDHSLSTQDDGWRQPLSVSYVAWDDIADQPSGTEWGTWHVPATFPPQKGATWEIDNSHAAPDASYGGGFPQMVRVTFSSDPPFSEVPRVIAGVRLASDAYDAQATFASTVHSVDLEGFTLAVLRVDQTWQHPSISIDYAAWEPSLATVNDDFYEATSRPVSGVGSLTGDLLGRSPEGDVQQSADRLTRNQRKASRVLDPYTLPRAQFGTHTLPPPVPTSAGFGTYTYPDSRWGVGETLAAGWGYGERGIRLPSSVRYDLEFSFKDAYTTPTVFNFSTPPQMIVSLRTYRDLVPEHQASVRDTFGVSLAGVTAHGFSVNVFRLDRGGASEEFDRGGRGWFQAIDLDWLAWEPWVDSHVPLDSSTGEGVRVQLGKDEMAYFRTDVRDASHDLLIRVNDSSPSLVEFIDEPTAATGAGLFASVAWLAEHVTPLPGLPANETLVLKLPRPHAPDASLVANALRMLNAQLIPGGVCGGGTRWLDLYAGTGNSKWRQDPDCAGSKVGIWPNSVAYIFSEEEALWYKLECAGAGCRHRLPSTIPPVQIMASTLVAFPGVGGLAKNSVVSVGERFGRW